jgi:uncharacterized protein YaiE (UPF0345 family)
MPIPSEFTGVTVRTRANVYFDGGVVSHTVLLPNGTRKTLGLIRPGSYHFGTEAAERMEIVAGACAVKVEGAAAPVAYSAGAVFEIPARSGFEIRVDTGLCEYICTFLP